MATQIFEKIDDNINNPLLSSKWQLLVLNQPRPNVSFLRVSTMILGEAYNPARTVMDPMSNPEYLLGTEMLAKYAQNILNIHGSIGIIDCYAQLTMYRRNYGEFKSQYLKESNDLDMFMAKAVYNFISEDNDFYFELMRNSVDKPEHCNQLTSGELDALVDSCMSSVYQDFEMTMRFPDLVQGVNKLRQDAKYDNHRILQKLESEDYKSLRTNLFKFSANMYKVKNELFVMNEKNLELLPQLIAELHGKLVEIVSENNSAWYAPFVGRLALNRHIDLIQKGTENKYLTVHALRRYPLGRNVFLTSSYCLGLTETEKAEYGMLMEDEMIKVHFLMQVDLCTTFKYIIGPLVRSEEVINKVQGFHNWKKEHIAFQKKCRFKFNIIEDKETSDEDEDQIFREEFSYNDDEVEDDISDGNEEKTIGEEDIADEDDNSLGYAKKQKVYK